MQLIFGCYKSADVTMPCGRDTTKEFMAAMPQVYERVLSCFAQGLGYPEDFFVAVRPLFTLPSCVCTQPCPRSALLGSTTVTGRCERNCMSGLLTQGWHAFHPTINQIYLTY